MGALRSPRLSSAGLSLGYPGIELERGRLSAVGPLMWPTPRVKGFRRSGRVCALIG